MRALLQLSSRQFERLVRDFYKAEGYGATLTRKGPDGGYDVRFYDTESKTMHIIECKRYSGYVNEEIIEKLDAVVRKKRDNYLRDGVRIQGILVTIGTISDEVSRIARGRGIKVMDGQKLISKLRRIDPEKISNDIRHIIGCIL